MAAPNATTPNSPPPLQTSDKACRENVPASMRIDNSSPEGAIRKAHLTLDTFSPVNQNGSFEFDRVIKSGVVLKRNRKTKVWKPILLVLRPNSLSIYKDPPEGTQLRHHISLADLTAVARQKDPKRKAKHVFGLFSPARNFHIEAPSEKEATEWVELIRREARIDEEEEEMILLSPSISRHADPMEQENIHSMLPNRSDHHVVGSSSSDPEPAPAKLTRPKGRSPYGAHTTPSTMHSAARKPSQPVHAYSGNEAGSMSDFSDTGFFPDSSLSLPKPSLSSTHPEQLSTQSTTPTAGASAAPSSATQPADTISNPSSPPRPTTTGQPSHCSTAPISDSERIVYHGYLYLLRTHRGLRQWKSLWCVLRPKGLALYKDEDEYKALLIIPFENIIDAVDIDPISRSKRNCFMVITEERNWKFCAMDEEGVMRWLGAVKSLVARRRAASLGEKDGEVRGRVLSREVKGENVMLGETSNKGVEVAATGVAASVAVTGDTVSKVEGQQQVTSLPIR